jgi:DNA-binding NarL/FixJ family response regulator
MTTRSPDRVPHIKVALVDDDPRFRRFVSALLEGEPRFHFTGAHADADAALRLIPFEKPEVLLLDLELPGADGAALIPRLKKQLPQLEILVLTVHDQPHWIFPAIQAGATGYLVKADASAVEIVEAIERVHAGDAPMSAPIARLVLQTLRERAANVSAVSSLTAREREILSLLWRGHTNKEIATALHRSDRTVGTHVRHVLDKLHVHSRTAAAQKYLNR